MRIVRAYIARGCLAAIFGAAALIGIADPSRASAHAVLLRSIPPARQTLPRAPDQVRLLFSEPIDPVFSKVHVFDANFNQVDGNDAHVDQDDNHLLVVSLRAGLPNGIYQVSWRSLSTIDVHPDQGQYSLFFGVPVPSEAPRVAAASIATTATPETTLGRWWFYLAASLFGGVLAVWKLVFSPALVDAYPAVRPAARRRAYRLIVLGGALLVLGTLFTAVAQAAAAADVPLFSTFGGPLADLLFRGRFAAIWWPRLALEVSSLLLIALGGLEGLAAECALATLPAVLLTSSLTSHGAALQELTVPAIATDWVHILGATAWVGGLVGVLILVPTLRESAASGLVPRVLARFFRFGLAASAMVVLSGTLQAVLEIGSWSGLIETTYGQLVLVKIALLLAMLTLAAFNERRGRTASGEGGLRRGVRVELALGIVVLAVAAVLTGTPPVRPGLS